MEAAVALVGFAASLITVTATVGESARIVHDLWTTFRDSPTNLKRLSDAIAENEALLKDMQSVSDAYERVGIPDSLISRWKSASSSACDDFRELNLEMSKILECTKGGELTKKHLRRRVRHFFSEKALETRCQQLTTHKADMSYIHLLMHSSYTIQVGEKLQSFGPDMETFRQESLAKLEGLKVSLEATQTDVVQAVQSELGRFKNSGSIQQAFNMVADQSIASERRHRTIGFNPESSLHSPRIVQSQRPCHQHFSGLVHAVEWHSQKYSFAIGTLQVEHVESVDVEIDEGENSSVRLVPCRSKKVRFIFQPPRWFSSLIMKIDIAMQIAQHGCTPSITWGSVPNERHLDPLVDELHEVSNLTLDRKLLAIARIGELDYLFEKIVSYCLGISYSDGTLCQKQRDARTIADALEQGLISFPGGEVGSRFLNKMAVRIGWTKNNGASEGEQSRADMQQTLSQSSLMKVDAILSDNARGYLSETQRAVRLTSNLIESGAQLPASLDFTSILMTDYGLWYLQSICPTLDITEVENLSLPSQWIFACLVRTVPACYESVSRQLQGFPANSLQRYTSTQRLAGEINSSQGYSRHRFLLSLILGGSMSMLESLLFHGLSMGDLSTYYLEIATRRGRMNIAQLLWRYGAFLSLETSVRLLEHMRPDLKTLLRDPRKSETFCHFLAQVLESCDPLQEIDDEHAIFESLVLIFQQVLLLSSEEQTSIASNSDDGICNKIVRLLLEAGLFRDSKLPARYWSFHGLLDGGQIRGSPLNLAIYWRNVYAIRLLLENGYNVDEVHRGDGIVNCIEHIGTPLTYAVWLGTIEAVTILLVAGADVTKMGAQGQTAIEMSEKCLFLPTPRSYKDSAEDIDSKDRKDEQSVRRLIFNMVSADLEAKHGMQYNVFIDTIFKRFPKGSCLRYADDHAPSSRYWSRFSRTCIYCPDELLGSVWHFKWGGFARKTRLCPCPCSDCLPLGSKSSHSPLRESWEKIVAPCKCSFIENSHHGVEETELSSDGLRCRVLCPIGNGQYCRLRVLYINYVTEEVTLKCPCATCSPDWKGVPCVTLGSLFDEDDHGPVEENDDPLIPAQDLTRVGEPCWRLGDLFNDDKTESFEYEDDSIIPAQDDSIIPAKGVGLHIFDDMPGFALAKNHRPSARQEVPFASNAPKHLSLGAEQSNLGQPDSRATAALSPKSPTKATSKPPTKAMSIHTLLSLFVSYIVTRSTHFTDTPRPISVHEVMEIFIGLSLSIFLVIIYECISIYTYLKDLPRPPPFLSKLVLLVLVVLGVRALKGNFGLV